MSYTPTQWKAGDTVTSAKLNKMEQGIANGGIMAIHANENGVLDKTWQEIHDGGFGVIAYELPDGLDYELIIEVLKLSDNSYVVYTVGKDDEILQIFKYFAQSPDDYPGPLPLPTPSIPEN